MRIAGRRLALWLAVLMLESVCSATSAAETPRAPIVESGWARPTSEGMTMGAGYLTIRNPGPAVHLVAARSALATRVEVHESRLEGGMARMRAVPDLLVGAGQTLRFEPGGLHLMLIGLTTSLRAGAHVPLVLRFEPGGEVAADLVVGDAPPAAHESAPRRIVTLAPNLTELVYAAGAGDRLVGTLDTSDYPAEARRIPRIGDVDKLDAERLLALRPDLVLVWGDGSPLPQRELLARLKLPTLSLEQHRLADVAATLEQLGRLFGTESVAMPAAEAFRARVAALEARYARAARLKVFYQVWSRPLYTLGGRHVADEMLHLCGADNVFAAQATSAFIVDEEAVYARDPDVLVLAGTRAESAEWLARWRTRAPLRAVQRGAVVVLDPDLVNRMGPRLAEGARTLCEQLETFRVPRG
jgi:iron complex transport system substrate-binding protein